MNKLLLILCIFSLEGCSSQTGAVDSKQFNLDARAFFLDHFNSLDLHPLREFEKCNLREAVMRDLDSLDDLSFDILDDRYLIKTYFEPYLGMPFSIVKDLKEGVFYFLCIPHFYDILYDAEIYYEKKKDNKYILKGPRDVIKVNAPLFDSFIEMRGSNDRQLKLSKRLIRATNPDFPADGNISVSEFRAKIQREYEFGLIPESTLKHLLEILDSSGYGNQEIVFIEKIGYLILVFDKAEDNVQFYFLPELERPYLVRSLSFSKYRNCD